MIILIWVLSSRFRNILIIPVLQHAFKDFSRVIWTKNPIGLWNGNETLQSNSGSPSAGSLHVASHAREICRMSKSKCVIEKWADREKSQMEKDVGPWITAREE